MKVVASTGNRSGVKPSPERLTTARSGAAALLSASDERARLKELQSLDLLDTPREERFDRYTRLISQMLGVPAATISLVDEHRQWFKSHVGMDVCETPREASFCTYAIQQDFLEVPDALRDDFFRNHPLVVGEPFIRFYAGTVLRGPSGQPVGTLCAIDYRPRKLSETERSWLLTLGRMVEEEINHHAELAHYRRSVQDVTLRDPGTGLPGELLFREALGDLVHIADAEQRQLVVVHLRVDNLDAIFRVHGRGTRDRVLEHLADHLTASDTRTLAAGRLSATSFGLVMHVTSARGVFDVLLPVINTLSEPIEQDGHAVRAEIYAGVSVFPEDGGDAQELQDRARTALENPYSHQRVHLFTRKGEEHAIRHHRVEQRLEVALRDGLLTFNYQPIFAADGASIVGFETLARWHDDQMGTVSPREFIPIIERNDRLSRMLTQAALRTGCEQARRWLATPGNLPLRVSVNIPARELYRDDCIEMVLAVLEETGLDANRLMLELTEESLVTDFDRAIRTMRALAHHDIQLALDDFGTGYSSLNYLRRLPVNVLKIDKSFVDDLPDDREAVELASGILNIAHAMGLSVVAEGIEHEAQRALLERLGCDLLQGFLLGRPVDAEAAVALVNA